VEIALQERQEKLQERLAKEEAEAIAIQERISKQQAEAIAPQERQEKLQEREEKVHERQQKEKLEAYLRSIGVDPNKI
jgi:hypothetical protein